MRPRISIRAYVRPSVRPSVIIFHHFGTFEKKGLPTDRRTDRRTDTPTYRDGWTHLKRLKRKDKREKTKDRFRIKFLISSGKKIGSYEQARGQFLYIPPMMKKRRSRRRSRRMRRQPRPTTRKTQICRVQRLFSSSSNSTERCR